MLEHVILACSLPEGAATGDATVEAAEAVQLAAAEAADATVAGAVEGAAVQGGAAEDAAAEGAAQGSACRSGDSAFAAEG